jgi:hypothetical protein
MEKRGRGRPPKEDALSPAERAKRYRDSQREKKLAIALSRQQDEQPADSTHRLFLELDKALARVTALEIELAAAHERIALLEKENSQLRK